MQRPEISVLIPVYNAERFLERCLDSVLSQPIDSLEIICLDNGSTDSSREILTRYAAKDARVRVIRQQNAGVARARNRLLELARGTYFFGQR